MDKGWEVQITLPHARNQEVINEFLASLKLSNCSHHTLYRYRLFLERFFGTITEPFSSISSVDIQKWFINYGEKLQERTIRVGLSILSSFYTFCVQEEYLERSPMKKRWYPRLPQSVPKYLEKEEIAKTRQHSERVSLRNQVLLEFLLTSGCRIAEAQALNRNDVDLDNRTAWVVGKGKKVRQVHFSEKCAVLLERYLDTFFQNPSTTPALFVSMIGNRVSYTAIYHAIKQIGIEAGLSTPLHPHRLRHTFATELLSKGAELSFIKDEMGHSNLTTTQIYARLTKKEIISLYRKFMG